MDPLFIWLETGGLSIWVRESTSVWAFPAILSAHAIGMGLAAGINAAIALHALGAGSQIVSKDLRRFVPLMWFGFWLNFFSGVLLLVGYPTKAFTNPVFYVKLAFIVVAMAIYGTLNRRFLGGTAETRRPATTSIRALAIAALVCWSGAITSGRFLAYTYTRLMASW